MLHRRGEPRVKRSSNLGWCGNCVGKKRVEGEQVLPCSLGKLDYPRGACGITSPTGLEEARSCESKDSGPFGTPPPAPL